MREIKFRAWSGEKIINNPCVSATNSNYDAMLNDFLKDPYDQNNDVDLILMQYTGLKDKNGTEIYEADIVESLTTIPYEVMFGQYSENHHGYYLYNHTKGFKYPLCGELKIIGNIYENQELLHG